jgi:hypothetical protein
MTWMKSSHFRMQKILRGIDVQKSWIGGWNWQRARNLRHLLFDKDRRYPAIPALAGE